MSEQLVSSDAALEPMLIGLSESLIGWPLWCYVDHGHSGRRTDDIPGWRSTRLVLPKVGVSGGFKPDNYIWNAHRYAVKCFVWLDAAVRVGQGVLVWLDADVRALGEIRQGFFAHLLGDASVAYLDRGGMHPETGCVVFRLPEALPILTWCRDAYVTGTFRALADGWTDCHVLRSALLAHPEIPARRLTSYDGAWTSKVDAFRCSPLSGLLRHFKGHAAKRELSCAI